MNGKLYISNTMNGKLYISNTIRSSEGQKRAFFIAFLGAMAISLSIVEHMVPKPFPWMRIGLANAITLYAFTLLKPREVMLVVLSRVIATSILIGSFLSITFILSFSGALTSFMMMYLFYTYLRKFFSIVGISVIGALTSNTVQLIMVNILFINTRLSYYFLPFILLFALLGGILSGWFSRFLVENI